MTRTASASAPRAPRLVAAAVLSVLAVLAPLSAHASAAPSASPIATAAPSATTSAPSTASSAATADGPPWSAPITFQAAAADEGTVVPGRQLLVSLTASNPSLSTVAAGAVDIEVGATALGTRAAVSEWLTAAESSGSFVALGAAELDSIAARGTQTMTVSVETVALDGWAPGIYPLRAVYASAEGALTSTSVVIIPDEDAGGTVAVIVPITAPALSDGLIDSEQLAELTADGGSLRAQLDAVTGTDAILAIDPAIPAAIRVLGTAAPVSATDWLAELSALPNDRFALQFGDADLQAQLSAGLSKPLTVPSLTAYIDPETVASTAPSPSPTAGADDGADGTVLPDVASLTAIGSSSRAAVYWPTEGTATPDAATTLGGLVQDDVTSLTVLSSAAVTGESGARAVAGDAQLLVYEADASRALRAASAAGSTVERAARLAEAAAYGILSAADEPLLVTVDRAADRDRADLHAAILAASDIGGRSTIGLDALAAAEPVEVSVSASTADEQWPDALATLLDDEDDIDQFATILEDATLLTTPERASILQLIGSAWHEDENGWTDAITTHRTQTATTLSSVGIDPTEDVNLIGSSIPLAFSVRNDLPWPVSLVLITEPNDPLLKVQTRTPVEAGTGQSTRVDVPVEARVGSGDATLSLQLQSPAYIPIGDPVTVSVTVRAEWESIGVVTMGVLVAGLLIVGAVRTVVRVRRRRTEEDATVDAHG